MQVLSTTPLVLIDCGKVSQGVRGAHVGAHIQAAPAPFMWIVSLAIAHPAYGFTVRSRAAALAALVRWLGSGVLAFRQRRLHTPTEL